MKIEILSETITNQDLFTQLSLQNSEIEFKLVEVPKNTRPIASTIIIAIISSLGVGNIIVAMRNAISAEKLKKMELEDKEKDRKLKEKELELNKEIEFFKLKAEKEKIVLQGYIEILCKHNEALIKDGKDIQVML